MPFDIPPKIEDKLDQIDLNTWSRRGLLTATGLLIIIYGYLFWAGQDPVPGELRSDLLSAQESHVKHKHKQALKDLKPFSRFEKYENTSFFDRANHLKTQLETILERKENIRTEYKEAMKHRIPSKEQTDPASANKNLAELTKQLDTLWKKHKDFLKTHEETATPYSETKGSMLELLLHRFVRLDDASDSSYIRLYKYKTRIYSRFLNISKNKVEQSGETPYRQTLDYINSFNDLVENTVFKPRAEQLRIKLRRKIAKRFNRLNKNCQEKLKEEKYNQAENLLKEHRALFKNVSPWEQRLENRIKTVQELKDL